MTETTTAGERAIRDENPRTGEVIESFRAAGAEEVAAAIGRARVASDWWIAQGPAGRRSWLLDFKKALARGAEDLAALISEETGKPLDDALLEVLLALEHLDWAARNARRVLGRRKVSTGLLMSNQKAYVDRVPFGVVGVIGPWNYPVYTPMGSISYALAAGNTVVFKPSELTPRAGRYLAETWRDLGASHQVLEVVIGDGQTGADLVSGGVDKIAFTGSPRTARRIMQTCAQNLTPLVVEGGGKDAMIVAADADLRAAAAMAAFGAMGNAGQTCAGIERVYVVEEAADEFIGLLVEQVRELRPGGGADADYGPMTLPGQIETVRRHVEDALARGGTAVHGGPESIGERYVEPVVLVDVPEESVAVCEETFGPTVVVNRVASIDEAVRRTNATRYGLAGSVYTRSTSAGIEIAGRIRAGAVSINSMLAFGGIGALPFGGGGDSGFGRIHGEDGLREFSRPKSITVERFAAPVNLMRFRRSARDMSLVRKVIAFRHVGRSK